MTTRMQQRRGTAAEWAAVNPILAAGEIGIETDTGVVKVGNGTSTWANLKSPYLFKTGGTIKALTKDEVDLTLQGNTNQAVDYLRITDVSGAILARISKDGKWYETGSENVTTKGDLLVGTGADLRKRLPVGSDALALLADASTPTGLRWGAVGKAVDVQIFTASGTWTKPANAKAIKIIMFGGGASGSAAADSNNYTGAGGGTAGARLEIDILAALLGATASVVVGSGGPASATNYPSTTFANGNPGGNTTFGPFTARGANQTFTGPGVNNPGSGGYPNAAPTMTDWKGPGGGGGAHKYSSGPDQGGSPLGTAATSRSGTGYGGDGGAGALRTSAGLSTASPGQAPGGGGGGATSGVTSDPIAGNAISGAGARGEVIVITYF